MPKALVIDDEAPLTLIISRFLEKAGFRVDTANSGAEGLLKATAEPPDVAVVDVMMPEMDGYEVCRRLRGDPRTARSTILVLTARGQLIDKQMALRAGADAHATKPFNGKTLIQEIQRLLAEKGREQAPLGQQIVVLHLAEGAGATTLAANLALFLAQREEYLTVLADMVLRGGHVGGRLGLEDTLSWLELLVMNADDLAGHLVRHQTGLFVLPAPPPRRVGKLDSTVLAQLFHRLRSWHDFVVVDTPRNLGALAPVLLKTSSLVLLLLTPDPTALRTAQASLAAIQRFAPKSVQVWPVLNRVGSQHHTFRQQVEDVLGLPVAAALPWAPDECARAVSSHKPVLSSAPESVLAWSFEALGQRILQFAEPKTRMKVRP